MVDCKVCLLEAIHEFAVRLFMYSKGTVILLNHTESNCVSVLQ